MAPSSSSSSDEGKRKSSMDKVKVSHLSRQLQLRLQYARLKVENGWHKQNLNEVENLYFKRTNNRPRPRSGFGPITQTSYLSTSSYQPVAPQSSLSFKTHHFPQVSESEKVSPASPSALHSSSSSSTISTADSSFASLNETQSSPKATNDSAPQTPSLSPSSRIEPHTPISLVANMSSRTIYPSPTLQVQQPTSSPSSSSSSFGPATYDNASIPLSARALQKQPQSVNPAQLSSSPSVAVQPRPASMSSMPAYPAYVSTPSVTSTFNQFTSTPATMMTTTGGKNVPSLTYDSFWSSHNASVIAKRPLSFRTSTGALGGSSREFGAGIGPGVTGVTAYPGSIDTGIRQ